MMVSWLIPKGGTSCQDVACVDYFSFFASYPLWLQALNISPPPPPEFPKDQRSRGTGAE